MSHENPRKIEHGTNRVLKSVCLLALHQQWPRLLLQSHYSLRHAPCVLRSKPWHTINTAECSLISVTYLQYNYIVPSFRDRICRCHVDPVGRCPVRLSRCQTQLWAVHSCYKARDLRSLSRHSTFTSNRFQFSSSDWLHYTMSWPPCNVPVTAEAPLHQIELIGWMAGWLTLPFFCTQFLGTC